MSPLVYVVILNYNGAQFLAQFLPILQTTTYPNYRIIIGDNASQDNSRALLRTNFPQVTCIELAENFGFAQGYNQTLLRISASLSRADYYLLLNSDVKVEPNWLQPLVAAMQADANLGICQPKILDFTRPDRFEYAGAAGGYMDLLFYPLCRGRLFTHIEQDLGQYEDACQVFWASGAAFMIRSQLFHELGGFNPYFFAHQEEIDLCWRAQLKGYKIQVIPKAVVYHVGGGTLAYNSPRKIYLNHRNTLIMLVNNLPFHAYCWRILLRMLLEAVGLATYYGFAGRRRAILPIWRAHWDFLKWYFFRPKQDSVYQGQSPLYQGQSPQGQDPQGQNHKGKSKVSGIYKAIFIFDYFLLGKRRFSQLNQHRFR